MPALPTPYDITPLPYYAYEPGLWEWLVFSAVVAAIFLCVVVVARRSKQRRSIESFGFALSELMKLRGESGQCLEKNQLARLLLIVKRLAGSVIGMPIAQLAPAELQKFLEGALSPAVKELLTRVRELESFKYQPDDAPLPPSTILSELIELVEKLERESRSKE